MMQFIGIDPGEKGAIALLNEDGSVNSYKSFPDINFKDLLYFFNGSGSANKVVIEKLWAAPIRGSQSNWALGFNCGMWKALLSIAQLSYVEIPPQTWQKLILNTAKKKSKETKPLSLAYVNKRYPDLKLPSKRLIDVKLYSGVSDAICMALYCRHLHLNQL